MYTKELKQKTVAGMIWRLGYLPLRHNNDIVHNCTGRWIGFVVDYACICSLVYDHEQEFQFQTHLTVNALPFGPNIVNIANVSVSDVTMVNNNLHWQRSVLTSIGKQCLLDI